MAPDLGVTARHTLRYGLGLLLALGLLLGAFGAQAEVLAADTVKAGFVYNFTKFVEWPAGSSGDLNICVAGRALGGALRDVDGRSSQGRTLRVRPLTGQGDMAGCQVLYIAVSEERRLKGLLDAAGVAGVLTVSDIEDFAEAGGMIGLYEKNNRIAFTINLPVARAAGLKLSSQLLRLGKVLQ